MYKHSQGCESWTRNLILEKIQLMVRASVNMTSGTVNVNSSALFYYYYYYYYCDTWPSCVPFLLSTKESNQYCIIYIA